jgi:HD-like signal output (HDOD) protein
MSQSAQQWVDTLSGETLPVLRRTLTQVRDQLNKSSVNHRDLARVISLDPAFSLYIIRLFRHMPNAPKVPVIKVSTAIPLLGMSQVKQACRSLPCLEDRLQGPPRRGLIDCYSRSAHAAIYAMALGVLQRAPEKEALYTAALLHDIGEMALWSREAERMRLMRALMQKGDGHEDAAMEVFGCTLHEISAGLSDAWQLPDLIKVSQGLFNSFQPRPLTVMLASALARESSLGWQRSQTLDHVELMAEFLEKPLDSAIAWFHSQAAEAARQLYALPIPLPAFQLIQSNRPKEKERSAVSEQASTRTVTPSQPEVPVPNPPVRKIPATKPASPTGSQSAGKSVKPLQQLISETLQEIKEVIGLQRVMFAMLNADKSELRARLVAETGQAPSLKGFSVDLGSPSLFSLLMKKPQTISLNPTNAEKYNHLIPPPLRNVINPQQCLAMSFFLHNKPIGLFYADRGSAQMAPLITAQQFANFKTICLRTTKTLV